MGPEKGKKVSRTIRFWRCVLLRYDIDRLDTRSIHSRYNMERCSTKPRRAWLSRFALWYVMSSFISAGYPSESPKRPLRQRLLRRTTNHIRRQSVYHAACSAYAVPQMGQSPYCWVIHGWRHRCRFCRPISPSR